MDDVPDDDQYDTEDSFIDDAELVSFYHCCRVFSYMDASNLSGNASALVRQCAIIHTI